MPIRATDSVKDNANTQQRTVRKATRLLQCVLVNVFHAMQPVSSAPLAFLATVIQYGLHDTAAGKVMRSPGDKETIAQRVNNKKEFVESDHQKIEDCGQIRESQYHQSHLIGFHKVNR